MPSAATPPPRQGAAASPAARVPGGDAARERAHASASPLPLIVGVVVTIVSLVIAVFGLVTSTPTILFEGFPPLPLIGSAWMLSVVGYLLTPMIVFLARGLDRNAQHRGMADPNFAPRTLYSRALMGLTIFGFVLGIWHLVNISVPLSEIVSGWFR